MRAKAKSFRVGKVAAVLRGRVWYLTYFEGGRRRRPRVGPDRDQARQMAAQINGQLEVGAPAALSYEPISVPDLRQRWLDHHEHVRRSSVATIKRYRVATEHLLTFVAKNCSIRHVCEFHARQAMEFVRYLRTIKIAPNGHPKARKRPMLDTGVKYILETCCSLFNYAHRNRHLSPYAENPFRTIEVSRMPVETFRPVVVFTEDQECKFLKTCDDWQFPLFLTLLLTGLRRASCAICFCRKISIWRPAGFMSVTRGSWAGKSKPATSAISRWCRSWAKFSVMQLQEDRLARSFDSAASAVASRRSYRMRAFRRCNGSLPHGFGVARQAAKPFVTNRLPGSVEHRLAGSGGTRKRPGAKGVHACHVGNRPGRVHRPKDLATHVRDDFAGCQRRSAHPQRIDGARAGRAFRARRRPGDDGRIHPHTPGDKAEATGERPGQPCGGSVC